MSSTLPIMETFHSIQGEGAHTGKSAFFIRIAKCTVGCKWCDTKQSWNSNLYPQKSVKSIAQDAVKAYSNGASFIVITGGEPLHHNLDNLTAAIRKLTRTSIKGSAPIHIETSGVDNLSGSPNWITLSPKPHAPPKKNILISCNELKVIIHGINDIQFAEQMAKKIESQSKEYGASTNLQDKQPHQPLLFLQPGWKSKEGTSITLDYIKNNPQWRLSMQTHKWLGIR